MADKITLGELLADRNNIEEISYFNLISICMDLCQKFSDFYSEGVFIHYSDEHRVLCDVLDGTVDKDSLLSCDILDDGKTPSVSYKYIAPEVLKGEEGDRYSSSLYTLSVLLFRVLTLSFPYEGKQYVKLKNSNEEQVLQFYKSNPSFIFSQKRKENRAIPGSCDNALAFWEVYPEFIKTAFKRVFEGEIGDEFNRPTEKEWLVLLKKLKKQLSICTACGVEMFFQNIRKTTLCWRCRKEVFPIELALVENEKTIAKSMAICSLERKCELYHVEVVVRGMRWGIKNHFGISWKWKKSDGSVVQVEKNKAVPLKGDLNIELNKNCYLKTSIKEVTNE